METNTMPELDSLLVATLKLAKTTPLPFALVAKGANEGRLFLAKKPPVPPKEIAAAKKELGGGQVFVGRCRWENEEYVFEVGSEPPMTLANTLRTIIKNKAGLTAKVIVRVAPDLAAEAAGASAEAGPQEPAIGVVQPPAPQTGGQGATAAENDAARFSARLKAMMPAIQKAQAGATPLGQEIKRRAGEAGALARNNDFTQANALLDQIEVQLKQAQQAAGAAVGDAGGMAGWEAARTVVVNQIRAVATAVAETKDPDAAKVVITLQSILKNLPAVLTTPQQIDEVKRYLEDDLITAAEEVPPCYGSLSIRTPLRKALSSQQS
jgi:hypothetical protein